MWGFTEHDLGAKHNYDASRSRLSPGQERPATTEELPHRHGVPTGCGCAVAARRRWLLATALDIMRSGAGARDPGTVLPNALHHSPRWRGIEFRPPGQWSFTRGIEVTIKPKPLSRPWWNYVRFSLRALIVVFLIGLCLGWLVRKAPSSARCGGGDQEGRRLGPV